MPDIIVKQQPATSLTVQSNSTQLLIRQAAANNITVATTGNSYVLPVATNSTLGGIIVGSNLTIANGVLSATSAGGGVTAFNNRTGNVTLTANDVTAVANGIYQANGSYLNDALTLINTFYMTDVLRGMRKSTGIGANFVAGTVTLGTSGAVGIYSSTEVSAIEFSLNEIFATLRLRHYAHTLIIQNSGFEVETGTANWTWSANSILTQGRGDARYQANGSYLNDVLTNVVTSYSSSEVVSGMRKSAGSANFVSGGLTLPGVGIVGVVAGNETSGIEFRTGGTFATMRLRQFAHTVILRNSGFEVETGTANWSWSANSILTQGRGDARYQLVGSYLTSANLTWSNITGKPTFATVATSGSYTDLANTPNLSLYLTTANASATYLPSENFTYANIGGTIPTATNTTLGAVKVGSNLTIANGVLSATSSGGFQNGDTLNGGTY